MSSQAVRWDKTKTTTNIATTDYSDYIDFFQQRIKINYTDYFNNGFRLIIRIALIVGRKRGWTKTKMGLDEDEKL